MKSVFKIVLLVWCLSGCSKKEEPEPENFTYIGTLIDGKEQATNVAVKPSVSISFSAPLSLANVNNYISLKKVGGSSVEIDVVLASDRKTYMVTPKLPLDFMSSYELVISHLLQSQAGTVLHTRRAVEFRTGVDSSDKFPRISDEELLTLIQRQTFKYFWDFGHPHSGMAKERNSSGDVVTTGGTGFGVMSILVAIERGFISRDQGYNRILKIVDFLARDVDTYHGAFPHWVNGNTGKTVAFSQKDNGADIVETSLLLQGLLAARQYFTSANELALRQTVTKIWEKVEWSWFVRDNVLLWHWSPDYQWDINLPVQGWNECLITYVLAASSPTYPISASVYQQGFTRSGAYVNGKSFYGVTLPLGEDYGGPLFFAHYSFLGLNPFGLKQGGVDFEGQVKAHSEINYEYCKTNPKAFAGYGSTAWGLTASDGVVGYSAHHPGNDVGVISPTAAVSSLPYTPQASMDAIRYFYYVLGDKLWGEHGFYDAFSIHYNWFANSYLAIDQGPQICMIENYRTQLLWKVFMRDPDVHAGLTKLGFQYKKD